MTLLSTSLDMAAILLIVYIGRHFGLTDKHPSFIINYPHNDETLFNWTRQPCSIRYFAIRLWPNAAAWCSPVWPQRLTDNRSTPLRWTASSWNRNNQKLSNYWAYRTASQRTSDALDACNHFCHGIITFTIHMQRQWVIQTFAKYSK